MKLGPLLFVIIFLFLININCKKDKPSIDLPAITEEGKNTIGFKIDNENWVPFYKCRYFGNPCGEIHVSYGPPSADIDHFGISAAKNFNDSYSFISISSVYPITTTGNKYDSINVSYVNRSGTSYSKSIYNLPGTFEIKKIDIINQIFSGIFSFKLYNTSGGTDSVQITDGRFDLKMNACICRN